MRSRLIITSVEGLQSEINSCMKLFGIAKGVYVSLNKTQKSIKNIFVENKIDVRDLFFIDCVSSGKVEKGVMQISPTQLDSLGYATVEDLEEAIGYPKEKLCLECWDF